MSELKWIAKKNNGFIVASEGFAVGPFRTVVEAHEYRKACHSRNPKGGFRVVILQEPEELPDPKLKPPTVFLCMADSVFEGEDRTRNILGET